MSVILRFYSNLLICLQIMADDFRTLAEEQAEESFPINKKKERRGGGDEKGWLALLPLLSLVFGGVKRTLNERKEKGGGGENLFSPVPSSVPPRVPLPSSTALPKTRKKRE